MPRLLVAIILTIIFIGYYIYKTQVVEPKKTSLEQNITTNKDSVVKKTVEKNTQKVQKQEKVKQTKKTKPVSQKKKDFYSMMVPSLNEVYDELVTQYVEIKSLLESNPNHLKIAQLKKKYKVSSNAELLVALKPHPKSIAIAQGAMESAWGTSRFYNEAYNIFGVWSFNKNDKRIAAGKTRGSTTIWLRKYDNVKESIHDYYLTMSRSKAFKAFKKLNYEVQNQNPYLLVKKLDRYSEKGALYGKELAAMISYNDFTAYDEQRYSKTSANVVSKIDKDIKKQVAVLNETKVIEVVDSIQDNESSYSDILKEISKEKISVQ